MDLARWHRGRLQGKVMAITGSCGKSTVKAMTGTILSRSGRCSVAPKSYNNRIGVSHSILRTHPCDDFGVLELGTNHPGEIDELAALARPHAGLITCIGDCHLEGLGSRHGVLEAKAELIPHLPPSGMLALNHDDDLCSSLADRHPGDVRTFGLDAGAQVRPILRGQRGNCQVLEVDGIPFQLPVPGHHNALNAAAAICLARWAGVEIRSATQSLAHLELPGLRFERRHVGGATFILDCYNSNPTAMEAALT
jgi:UDP-N-acetylmuramoyl-tripeptide--D-alanyl-D-alanine ligase